MTDLRVAGTRDTDHGPDEAADRGRTVIEPAVVERIAVQSATEVDGVTRSGTGLESVIGRRYPKASAQVAGSHAKVDLDLAVIWPHPLADVCASVRDRVSQRVHELTGMEVDRVHVTAVKVVAADEPSPRRVQ